MATLMYSFWRSLEATWTAVCDDISRGEVNAEVSGLDPEVIRAVNDLLTPDPERADELVRQFKLGFQGIARRVWPNCRWVVLSYCPCFFRLWPRNLLRILIAPQRSTESISESKGEKPELIVVGIVSRLSSRGRYVLTTCFVCKSRVVSGQYACSPRAPSRTTHAY